MMQQLMMQSPSPMGESNKGEKNTHMEIPRHPYKEADICYLSHL